MQQWLNCLEMGEDLLYFQRMQAVVEPGLGNAGLHELKNKIDLALQATGIIYCRLCGRRLDATLQQQTFKGIRRRAHILLFTSGTVLHFTVSTSGFYFSTDVLSCASLADLAITAAEIFCSPMHIRSMRQSHTVISDWWLPLMGIKE
ncbi:hypothetical protein KTQ42_20935 [Noviherbaspirillum sp. L7-7A]|uniref:hypothetical protein n=1 Tax=Noviherbaspirillum sp. L7-7A TaxID=2850560 RepID=UPI001C2CABE6|nr:hypothetical protein [Noviherbaspirillum sp. L7-7A]MBV0881752.1 hypothetical protein [Noviherbaspirillum sp. L7-7A]